MSRPAINSGVIQQINRTATQNIYSRKDRFKLLLFVLGLVIAAASLYYNQTLADQLTAEERKRVALMGLALKQLDNPNLSTTIAADAVLEFIDENTQNGKIDASLLRTLIENNIGNAGPDMSLPLTIIRDNNTIPLIVANERDSILNWRNFSGEEQALEDNPQLLQRRLSEIKQQYAPVEIDLAKYFGGGQNDTIQTIDTEVESSKKQYIYYTDSETLAQLKMYPYVQLLIIFVFIGTAYILFSISRRSEQNKVWLGMAKETAHQLGTPLFSLLGWVELLRHSEDPSGQMQMIGDEVHKDILRLQLIADRFSKIGSEPNLETTDIVESVAKIVDYIKRRAASKISFTMESTQPFLLAEISPTLFEWVIENLLKNALDAIEGGAGSIQVWVMEEGKNVAIEVSDTGKGIPRNKFKTIFRPGYSTKKRGWGLGLSLCKRIIENFHKGDIFVKESVIDKGTTFRVLIPKKR